MLADDPGSARRESLSFGVAAWAAWTGAGEALIGTAGPSKTRLPAGLRRRATTIGRRALDAAWAVLPGTGAPRLVLSSRHGEYQRTEALLQALAHEGAVSPAEFCMSVHHGLLGLLSIATHNRAGHTALAAGPETFGYGLLEAAACAAEDRAPVLLVHFDEPLPEAYAPVVEADAPPLVLALLITHPVESGGDGLSLAWEPAANPPHGDLAASFLTFLSSQDTESRCCGERLIWTWSRESRRA